MSKKYYIYKMYNDKDELLYIGKTHNLYARMNAHFSNSQLKDQAWKLKVDKIEVIELYNQYDIDIIEIYLIGKEKPKYNSDKVYENISPSFNINYKIKNKDGKLIGLRAFIDTLRNSNYKVNSKRKKIKNVLYTYYMITE